MDRKFVLMVKLSQNDVKIEKKMLKIRPDCYLMIQFDEFSFELIPQEK